MAESATTSRSTRRWIFAAILSGLLLSAFFGFGALRSFIRIQATGLRPGVSDAEAIRGWMTVPYISRVFDIPPEDIYRRIGVPAAGSDAKSLQALNKEFFPGQRSVVLQRVKEAILSRNGSGLRQEKGP